MGRYDNNMAILKTLSKCIMPDFLKEAMLQVVTEMDFYKDKLESSVFKEKYFFANKTFKVSEYNLSFNTTENIWLESI